MLAIEHGQSDIVEKLIKAGSDIEARDKRGCTPLMWAIEHRQSDIVEKLIEARSDIDVQDERGCTPLMWAIECRRSDIAKKLIEIRSRTDVQDERGYTLLMLAMEHGMDDVVRQLLENGADAKKPTKTGLTPLALAIIHRSVEQVQILIKYGAEVNICNENGNILLMLADQTEMQSIIELIEGRLEQVRQTRISLQNRACQLRSETLRFSQIMKKTSQHLQEERFQQMIQEMEADLQVSPEELRQSYIEFQKNRACQLRSEILCFLPIIQTIKETSQCLQEEQLRQMMQEMGTDLHVSLEELRQRYIEFQKMVNRYRQRYGKEFSMQADFPQSIIEVKRKEIQVNPFYALEEIASREFKIMEHELQTFIQNFSSDESIVGKVFPPPDIPEDNRTELREIWQQLDELNPGEYREGSCDAFLDGLNRFAFAEESLKVIYEKIYEYIKYNLLENLRSILYNALPIEYQEEFNEDFDITSIFLYVNLANPQLETKQREKVDLITKAVKLLGEIYGLEEYTLLGSPCGFRPAPPKQSYERYFQLNRPQLGTYIRKQPQLPDHKEENVLRHFKISEMEDFRVTVDPKGRLVYVRDPNSPITTNGNGLRNTALVDVNGNIYLLKARCDLRHIHHSSTNLAIVAAGEIFIENGVIRGISNQSGHYKPHVEVIEIFAAALDKARRESGFEPKALAIDEQLSVETVGTPKPAEELSEITACTEAIIRGFGAKRQYSFIPKPVDPLGIPL
jgi:ankyrin repeat protein